MRHITKPLLRLVGMLLLIPGAIPAQQDQAQPDWQAWARSLQSGTNEEKCRVLKDLPEFGVRAKQLAREILNCAQDTSCDVRKHSAEGLAQIVTNEPGLIQALLTLMRDSDLSVRLATIRSVGRRLSVPSEALLPDHEQLKLLNALIRSQTDSSERIRSAAVLALGRTERGGTLVLPFVEAALDDPILAVQEDGLVALLQRVVHDDVKHVPPHIVGKVVRHLQSHSGVIRQAAILALGAIGPGAKTALPALMALSQDPGSSLREEALEAIRRIQNP
jgi:HEAT repeat protein